jgi:hypothetical protein
VDEHRGERRDEQLPSITAGPDGDDRPARGVRCLTSTDERWHACSPEKADDVVVARIAEYGAARATR